MLKPREADIPALFLVLVVLPLVAYILLGKWNEAAKKNARIGMLAQLAAEEAFRVEAMATASVIPVGSSSKTGFHQCARCFAPATTRCSRCKSVRYCSGKCQIVHWRQGHKQECLQSDDSNSHWSSDLSSIKGSIHQSVLWNENPNSSFFKSDIKEPMLDAIPPGISLHPSIATSANAATTGTAADASQVSQAERKLSDRWASSKFNRDILKCDDTASFGSLEGIDGSGANIPTLNTTTMATFPQSKETPMRNKLGNGNSVASSGDIQSSPSNSVHGRAVPRNAMHPPYTLTGHNGNAFESSGTSGISASLYSEKNAINAREIEVDLGSNNVSQRSTPKASREYPCPGIEKKMACMTNDTKIPQSGASATVPTQGNSGIAKMGDAMMMGLKKLPKLPRWDTSGIASDSPKNKVLFPYEEFVKFFHYEVCDLSPRGLLNCGNSCYANAVLQCLTCTKPLIIYLLRRSHSKTCWAKDWCLMCELEQHILMLREGGGPLSPSRILSHMRNIGCRMGGGDQEDAHEFLRLLVTSMQSICLEGMGGEKEVDSSLQETTLIQQIFGGRLRSKVKCLKCHHESERYENIMDLTLEIQGWVESLEDALTQFTAPEDLDGENMYRCGRCAAYVKARKQLSIHEAPNILTIVLKRFQTGKYGKINKCISFPDMLDMIPFMTGTGDSPPLYTLYGVVVHLDTLNASFSGHYVSYVKDLQGTWLRIDDTEVEPVPMSQVMSEGAYILFYSRSHPRPPRVHARRNSSFQAPSSAKHWIPKPQKSSRHGQCKPSSIMFSSGRPSPLHAAGRNILPTEQTHADSICTDYSDATSSDWSLFTSSDESSFTTESTRDSFSTVDYGDPLNIDPFPSIFSPLYGAPEYSNNICKTSSPCRPQTRFFSETNSFVLDSSMSNQPLGSVHKGRNPERVSVSSPTESLTSAAHNCSMSVRYGSNSKGSFARTCGCCEL
ncbi:ubiquitin C-terminal hydrolase 15-like isoform X2 [Magnolia sinica]|uniref:ubiquitin C-terminal hydrolase 15-like isoform X2 n=1 Tax=Magnolia sinica TaxID=86752 RepID=UPI00265A95E0|nr:ubiquitin C-terminal hydrolase 15-like isoform X2 [Magnolia sinica]